MNSLGKQVAVCGGSEKTKGLTNKVYHGDEISLGQNVMIKCLATPCHTQDHICYLSVERGATSGAVFTGDTLFLGGCGKFFEGNPGPEQMNLALNTVLASLPDSTLVFCGHEYTESNLKFAVTVDPSPAVINRLNQVNQLRSRQLPTIPGTIGEEKLTNPFMRVSNAAIQARLGTYGDPIATMAALREMKNNFRPPS
ncbi:hypothetical protein Ciccas_008995 [Cichlidogyrus casuarinus]|uniref:Hydroxyacylglutathione hydrolase C-terminal domain-containing protein n=1 Tax=Cichlidogyrus casuarinus TaxID=1844966 RepID=A0ABD2PYZ9_9PLAT